MPLISSAQDSVDHQLKQFQMQRQQGQEQQRHQQQKEQKEQEMLEATIVDLLNQLSASQVLRTFHLVAFWKNRSFQFEVTRCRIGELQQPEKETC